MPTSIVRNHLECGEWRLAHVAATQALAALGETPPQAPGVAPRAAIEGGPERADRQHEAAGRGNRRSRRDRPAIPRALLEAADPADRGPLLALLARVRVRLGMPAEALSAAVDAVAGWTHTDSSLALAEAWIANGDAPAARALLGDLLSAARADAEGGEDPHAEVVLGVALAEACRAAGDPEAGLGIATRALAFAERTFGEGSPQAAEALHQLGVCLHGAGQLERAGTALQRALAIRRRQVPDTALVALTLDALGRVRRREGEPLLAVALHREALELWTAALGDRAGPVSACRHSLAQALHNTGDFLGAREEMVLAWTLTSRTLGTDHVDTWITAFELGRFELDVGMVEEGLQRMEQARGVVRDRLGREHPVVRAMDRWL